MKTTFALILCCVFGCLCRTHHKNSHSTYGRQGSSWFSRVYQQIVFDNRSNRKVKLSYVDLASRTRERLSHSGIFPNSGRVFYTENYEWSARDEQGNYMLLNGRYKYVTNTNAPSDLPIITITRQGFPKIALPEIFIETLMVLDYSSFALHSRSVLKAKRYAMTLFKFTNDAFHNKDLKQHGFKINIVASEIVILQRKTDGPKISSTSGETSLQNTCTFMNAMSKKMGKKFDFMIFVTRKPVGQGAGFAWHKSMCNDHGCTVVNDHGFPTSFVIAHEIAHSIGLEHQDFPGGNLGYVMTIPVKAGRDDVTWSQYSIAMFFAYIRNYGCLKNKATKNSNLPIFHKYPGIYYTYDQQCLFQYGEEYEKYSTGYDVTDPCDMKCGFKNNPAYFINQVATMLDGSPCGQNKWCVSGKCVDKKGPMVKVVNGNWHRWSSWTACSTTCGVGVRRRKRACDNPKPQNGGKYCIGARNESASCNLKSCPVVLNCDFSKDLCSWKSIGGEVKWTKHSTGNYIYVKAMKNLTNSKKKTQLTSQEVKNTPQACVYFEYHFYGPGVFRLKMRVESNRKKKGSLWNVKGNQGNAWRTAKVNITNTTPYKVVIESVVSGVKIGQTRLRNIKFSTKACT